MRSERGAGIRFASRYIIAEIDLHVDHGRACTSLPSRPMTDTCTGIVSRDGDGKLQYEPVLRFHGKLGRNRRSARVVDAVEVAYSDAPRKLLPDRAA